MSRKTFQRIVALSIAAAAAIVIVLVVSSVTGNKAESAARDFIGQIKAGDVEKSYQEASPVFRESFTPDEWEGYVIQAKGLINEPVLVAEDTSTNTNKLFAYENPVSYFTYSIVVELEDNDEGWQVRHIDIQPRKFDIQRFGGGQVEESLDE